MNNTLLDRVPAFIFKDENTFSNIHFSKYLLSNIFSCYATVNLHPPLQHKNIHTLTALQ